MAPTSKPTLTPRDLANRLEISESLAWRLGREHRVPGVIRIGRLMRFDADVIEQWLASGGSRPGLEPIQSILPRVLDRLA